MKKPSEFPNRSTSKSRAQDDYLTDAEIEFLEDLVAGYARNDTRGTGTSSAMVAYSALQKIRRFRYEKR